MALSKRPNSIDLFESMELADKMDTRIIPWYMELTKQNWNFWVGRCYYWHKTGIGMISKLF